MNSSFTSHRNHNTNWTRLDNYLLGKIKANKKSGNMFEKVNNEGFYSGFSSRMQKSGSKFMDYIKPLFNKIIF